MKYQPRNPAAPPSGRIDDIMYCGQQPTPTGIQWPYPLNRPSSRFQQLNSLVRQLDVRFAELSGAVQGDWDSVAVSRPWWTYCLPEFFYWMIYATTGGTGLQAYRNVNSCRYINGLGVSDNPPSMYNVYDNDQFTQGGSLPFAALWFGRSSPPTGTVLAHIRGVGLNHAPERGPQIQRYRWGFAAPIAYGSSFDLAPLLASQPGLAAMPCISVCINVVDEAACTFAAGRVTFTAPYS